MAIQAVLLYLHTSRKVPKNLDSLTSTYQMVLGNIGLYLGKWNQNETKTG